MAELDLNLIPFGAVCLGAALGLSGSSPLLKARTGALAIVFFLMLAAVTSVRALTVPPWTSLRAIIFLQFLLAGVVVWAKRRKAQLPSQTKSGG